MVSEQKLEEYSQLIDWLQANRARLDPTMAGQLEFIEEVLQDSADAVHGVGGSGEGSGPAKAPAYAEVEA